MSILVLYKPADAVQYTAAGLAAHSQVLELVVPRKIVRRVGRDRPHPLGIFEPERIDKLLRKVRLQDAVLYILLIIGSIYWSNRPGLRERGFSLKMPPTCTNHKNCMAS